MKTSRANYVEESFEEAKDSTFFACNIAKGPQTNVWLEDTGFSNHMIGKSDLFVKLDDCEKSS